MPGAYFGSAVLKSCGNSCGSTVNFQPRCEFPDRDAPMDRAKKQQLSPWASGLVGMLAAVGTNFMLYPLDLTKVRLQGTVFTPKILLGRPKRVPRVISSHFVCDFQRRHIEIY